MFDRYSAIAAIEADVDGATLLLSIGIPMLIENGLVDCEPTDALEDLQLLENELDFGLGASRLIGNDRLCRLAAGAIDEVLGDRRAMARLPVEAATTGPALSAALHG